MKATLKDHMDEFAQRWDWWLETWHAELLELEQRRLAVLTTENERDAYRIIHSSPRTPLVMRTPRIFLLSAKT